jgi:hypothetical protein
MTMIRDINRERRKAGIVFAAGFATVALGVFLSQLSKGFIFLAVGGIGGLFVGLIQLGTGIRCPKCRGSLGYGAALSSKLRFCPFCGVCFDTLAEEKAEPSAGGNAAAPRASA